MHYNTLLGLRGTHKKTKFPHKIVSAWAKCLLLVFHPPTH